MKNKKNFLEIESGFLKEVFSRNGPKLFDLQKEKEMEERIEV